MRQKKKADADVQRREEKAAKEKVKQEREARSYNTVLQVSLSTPWNDRRSFSIQYLIWCGKQNKLHPALQNELQKVNIIDIV